MYEFEEDNEPTWLVKQKNDAIELADKINSKKTRRGRLKKGDIVGKFVFIERHWHFKHKHYYLCPVCKTKFLGHSNVRNKKNCKYCIILQKTL